MKRPTLPADGHTHTQWSWDAAAGSMEGSCARAVELGLPAIAFTEHVDGTRWATPPASREKMRRKGHDVADDGRFEPPPFDVEGYLASVADCREKFPELRILTGAELGEPHWYPERGAALVATGAFERMLGSLHHAVVDGTPWAAHDLFGARAPEGLEPAEAMRIYLREIHELVTTADDFAVLAHIDFPIRHWPGDADEFKIQHYEEEFRAVLVALAAAGRGLEVNTGVPLDPEVVRWWTESGGRAVAFGSDAHKPSTVGHGFAEAAAMVESHGFRPGAHPHEMWLR